MVEEAGVEIETEKEFDSFKGLAPIEHYLFGSSFDLPDGKSSIDFENDPKWRADREYLLKVMGVWNNSSTVEEAVMARRRKVQMEGDPAILEVPEEYLGRYRFAYVLESPDEDGLIPNDFSFKLERADSRPMDKRDGRIIKTFKPASKNFSLSPFDWDTSTLHMSYTPLK